MSRIQLALRVADLEKSVAFYTALFGAEPAKQRPGYANFAIAEPPLKLVLIEGDAGAEAPTVMDHLGVEVTSTEAVDAATDRFKTSGLATFEESDSDCCYAVQDKVWVQGPGNEPWEVYVVKGEGTSLDKAAPTAEDIAAGAGSNDVSASPNELAKTMQATDQQDACCAFARA
ncbi:MAG: ArsI/CadI family heavy metal resistance metalloenzyme [Ornithinimicrobium sp.]